MQSLDTQVASEKCSEANPLLVEHSSLPPVPGYNSPDQVGASIQLQLTIKVLSPYAEKTHLNV